MQRRPVTIVVLTKYPDILAKFVESAEKYASKFRKVVVADNKELLQVPVSSSADGGWWEWVQGPEKFSMAGNGNIGFRAANPLAVDCDVLYCGDDVRFLENNTIEKLQEIAYSDPEIGILSPKIVGRGSQLQTTAPYPVTYIPAFQMWFPCVYIKSEVFAKIGFLDEQFNDFGSDDLDFCIRAQLAGFKLAVTNQVSIQHEASPDGGPTTFCRAIGTTAQQQQQTEAFGKLRGKYKISDSRFLEFLSTGNLSLLSLDVPKPAKPVKEPPTPADAMKHLKSRSLYIATPAYGGWLSVNYIFSLLALKDLCNEAGVKLTITFMHNESLITRARNRMANEYLATSDCTDFFFIDADIGFNPKDVLMLTIREEDVIGAPCVRKSFRWDRVLKVVKANNREFTGADLEKISGEFVINFPPGEAPASLNLGELVEVRDVGTGLMRIKRETFQKVSEAFPENRYMAIQDEGQMPMQMFFQSRMDEDSRKENSNGLPHYIPEDYAFCRDVRKAGMKVWMAPWMKTNHMGSYMFTGDLEAVALAGGGLR